MLDDILVGRLGQQKFCRLTGLRLRPSLRSVQNSQDDYLFFVNLVDCDERERRKGDLSRALHPTRTPKMRERLQRADALNHGLCHSSGGIGTALGDVIADPFEIIRGVRRPADAHQPR